ncbi:PREDICTED: putative germin-like protein 2-1 [Ipomoea nil]|uniref:putative germin-like protein 2-1 n=1 Tax=Ipomoea nil TaxID=35883 RepID=UPI000901F524|nr:PREDICTED: putative germin-like protein 2-1 [Ipomoea nil]
MAFHLSITLAIVAFALSSAYAYDPSPLQDFCVASNDPKATIFVNGRVCKDPKLVTSDDFFTSGLNTAKTPTFAGSTFSAASINEIPGLNTLGLTLIRNDFEPDTVTPPHIHPRATELALILEGSLYFGFVTTDPSDRTKNRVYAKTYNAGDVFVIPQGLIHFGLNVGSGNATTIAIFNSQSPGFNFVPDSLFRSNSSISDDVLSKSFRVDKKVIKQIRSQFS